jgi:hypothetical protein
MKLSTVFLAFSLLANAVLAVGWYESKAERDIAVKGWVNADNAATECGLRTGYKYNCEDGTQSASCK